MRVCANKEGVVWRSMCVSVRAVVRRCKKKCCPSKAAQHKRRQLLLFFQLQRAPGAHTHSQIVASTKNLTANCSLPLPKHSGIWVFLLGTLHR